MRRTSTIWRCVGVGAPVASSERPAQDFFLLQILVTAWIAEMVDDVRQLYDRELLRAYLQEESGRYISDAELDGFVSYLQTLAVATSRAQQAQPRVSAVRRAPAPDAPCCHLM